MYYLQYINLNTYNLFECFPGLTFYAESFVCSKQGCQRVIRSDMLGTVV